MYILYILYQQRLKLYIGHPAINGNPRSTERYEDSYGSPGSAGVDRCSCFGLYTKQVLSIDRKHNFFFDTYGASYYPFELP
jgi:hypothetical protein